MKRIVLAAAWAVELAIAGVAVAHGIDGSKSVSAVSATFTAKPAGTVDTRTCTTAAGKQIAVTRATYAGVATGSADLAGTVTIAAVSTIDTTDGVGVVGGTLGIAGPAGRSATRFTAVYDHGSIVGTLSGRGPSPRVQLLGNLSAGFSAAAGFTGGRIGGGTSGGSAVELAGGSCSVAPPPGAEPRGASAEGTITAETAASITVGGLTCAVPPSLAVTVITQFPLGERVRITCSDANGTKTLVRIEKRSR